MALLATGRRFLLHHHPSLAGLRAWSSANEVISLDTNVVQLLAYSNISKDSSTTLERKKQLTYLSNEGMSDEQLTRLFKSCEELEMKLSGKAVVGATACSEYYSSPAVSIL